MDTVVSFDLREWTLEHANLELQLMPIHHDSIWKFLESKLIDE